jgi:hypothetical protein
MTYTPAHNLAKILSMFHDNASYDRISIRRGKQGSLDVRFLDSHGKMLAKFDCSFLLPNFPIILEFLGIEDTRLAGLYGDGYPGLRTSFMLGSMDEGHIAEYWARRKKPKAPKRTRSSRYKYQSKEERSKQVQAAKALLA